VFEEYISGCDVVKWRALNQVYVLMGSDVL